MSCGCIFNNSAVHCQSLSGVTLSCFFRPSCLAVGAARWALLCTIAYAAVCHYALGEGQLFIACRQATAHEAFCTQHSIGTLAECFNKTSRFPFSRLVWLVRREQSKESESENGEDCMYTLLTMSHQWTFWVKERLEQNCHQDFGLCHMYITATRRLAIISSNNNYKFDVANLTWISLQLKMNRGHLSPVYCIEFDRSGHLLVTVSS